MMKSIHHSDSGNSDSENHWFGRDVLKNQIQALSRTTSVFKDFPGLENLEIKFEDFQGLSRTHKSHDYCHMTLLANADIMQT